MDRIVSIEEAKQIISDAYSYIWGNAKDYDRDAKIYLHWTADNYTNTYDDYNFCIDGEGNIHYTGDVNEPVSATYKRNSGSIAIALCCAYNAMCWPDGSYDLGPYPPTDAQIYAISALTEAAADALDLTIDLDRIMTHGEAADNEDGLYLHEPYAVWSDPQPSDGITRWDLAILKDGDEWRSGGDTIRGNAIYIREHKDDDEE